MALHPKQFELQEGGKSEKPQDLTQVSDWGEQTQPTHMQLEV
ncbi:addiction module toxin RelE [Serratia marcescens]|nr:addiction module toxin RelE [Serratia marcescens]